MLFLGLLSVPEEPPAYDGMSNEKLLTAAGKGDKEAFHRLYENTYRTVYSYILSIAKNPWDILVESSSGDVADSVDVALMNHIQNLLDIDFCRGEKDISQYLSVEFLDRIRIGMSAV